MMWKNKITRLKLYLITACIAISGCVGTPRVNIQKVKKTPEDCVNNTYLAQGRVKEIVETEKTGAGVYVLMDDTDDRGIRVKTTKMPGVGAMVCLRVFVDADTKGPFLKELKRSNARVNHGKIVCRDSTAIWIWILLGTGGVLLVATMVMLFMFLSRSSGEKTNEQYENEPGEQKTGPEVGVPTTSAGLRVADGPDTDRMFPVTGAVMSIGRSQNNDIVLNDPFVGRNHARLSAAAEKYVVEDLESANGTFVNGQRIQDATTLKNGDRIEVGHTILELEMTSPVQE